MSCTSIEALNTTVNVEAVPAAEDGIACFTFIARQTPYSVLVCIFLSSHQASLLEYFPRFEMVGLMLFSLWDWARIDDPLSFMTLQFHLSRFC